MMFEIVVLVVFLTGAYENLPVNRWEGPFLLPGFKSLGECQSYERNNHQRWLTNEAREHPNVSIGQINVMTVCRPSEDEGA